MLYEVVNKRSSIVEGSLSIDEVNDYLDELSQNMGKSYVFLYGVSNRHVMSMLQRCPGAGSAANI